MNRIPRLYWLVSALCVAFVISWLFSPSNSNQNNQNEISVESDYFIQNVTIKSFAETGLLENKLKAKKLEHFKNNQISVITDATIHMKSKSHSFWSIHALKGQLDHNLNQVKLTESVQIIQSPQITQSSQTIPLDPLVDLTLRSEGQSTVETLITTQDLNYDLNKNIAETKNKIMINNNNMTTIANSMSIDLNIEKVSLIGQAQTSGELDE